MIAITLTLLSVIVVDQLLKHWLRRVMAPAAASLGPLGQIRVVKGRLWLSRLHDFSSRRVIWGLWAAAAITLTAASRWIPSSAIFVGLLLGGSFSNGLDGARRGGVSDYICLPFWPAFNLADLALAIGGIGTLAQLLIVIASNGIVT